MFNGQAQHVLSVLKHVLSVLKHVFCGTYPIKFIYIGKYTLYPNLVDMKLVDDLINKNKKITKSV